MKVIIAGTRNFCDAALMADSLKDGLAMITEVVCGCAQGADTLGQHWAHQHHIPVKFFPADWKTHGKKAGILRNQQMADYADSAIVFWDGASKGSHNMIAEMKRRNKPCRVIHYTAAHTKGRDA